jgi:hypothetical protein
MEDRLVELYKERSRLWGSIDLLERRVGEHGVHVDDD